jgi:prolyl-tRNA synthetase
MAWLCKNAIGSPAAATEVLSNETELRWPLAIAPFSICVIGPKRGSREATIASPLLEQLIDRMDQLTGGDDVILDDRDKFTVGRRLQSARRMGYPFIVLFGKKSAESQCPLVELHLVNEEKVMELPPDELIEGLQAKICRNTM